MGLTQVSKDGVKNDAIDASKLPANSVGASELADNAVDTNAIANNAVTAGKLASGVQTTINNNADNRVITGSGSANTLNAESGVQINSNGRMMVNGTYGAGMFNVTGETALGLDAKRQFLGINSDNDDMNIRATYYSGGASGAAYPDIKFQTTETERLRITASGNVGINTSAPTYHLQIGDSSIDSGNVIRFGKRVSGSNSNLPLIGHHSGGTGSGLGICSTSGDGHIHFFTGNDPAGFGTGNNTERMRIRHAGGITFNGDTAAANALDDYEEGTYAVTLSGNSGNYSLHGGVDRFSYIKIGRLVTIFGRILITAHNNVTGTPRINLPFNSMTGTEQSGQGQFGVYWHGWDVPSDGTGVSSLEFSGNSSVAYLLYHRDNTSWAGLNDLRTNMGNLYMALHGSYMTDS